MIVLQVDMFSDYASVSSSSGTGSNVSRSSSVGGDADAAALVGALGPSSGGSGAGAESDDSIAPLPSDTAGVRTTPHDIARSPAAPIAGRSPSGERELTGSLQRYLLLDLLHFEFLGLFHACL